MTLSQHKKEFDSQKWFVWEQPCSPHLLMLTLEAAMREFRKLLGYKWPKTILVFEEGQTHWLNLWSEMHVLGKQLLNALLDTEYRNMFYRKTFPEASVALEAKVTEMNRVNFEDLKNPEVANAYREFTDVYRKWYALGWYAEPVQWACEPLLRDAATWLVNSNGGTTCSIDAILGELTSPMTLSYSASIDLDLWAICNKYAEFVAATPETALLTTPQLLRHVMEERPDIFSALKAHQEKYFWKRTNYYKADRLTIEEIVEEVRALVTSCPTVGHFQHKSESFLQSFREKCDKRISTTLKLPESFSVVAEIASLNTAFKDERKRLILQCNSVIGRFIDLLQTRFDSSDRTGYNVLPDEFASLFAGEIDYERVFEEAEDRAEFSVVYWGELDALEGDFRATLGSTSQSSSADVGMQQPLVVSGNLAERLLAELDHKLELTRDKDETVKGDVFGANGRPIREIVGRVVVIRDPGLHNDFVQGDILIAPSTTPDYIRFFDLAGAIVTDIGGAASHAAHIASERNVPAIVGTGRASKVFHTGDMVCLNLDTGEVNRNDD